MSRRERYFNNFISIFEIIIYIFTLLPGDDDKRFPKVLTDDNSKFTEVGNIGITVTNFGTYRNGFGSFWHATQPSCEFPLGSRIEHIFDGGLWIGGYQADDSLGSGEEFKLSQNYPNPLTQLQKLNIHYQM